MPPALTLEPLHRDFGVEVVGADLRAFDDPGRFPALRAAFETHSLLLFRGQHLSDQEQLALGRRFGPLEDRIKRPEPKIAPVTNLRDDGRPAPAEDSKTLSQQANQLWHTDSTFLPKPALANLLQARVVPQSGGETEFVSTRAGWRRLDSALRERLRRTFFRHRYSHSRLQISEALSREHLVTQWDDQVWRAVWTNPVTGEEALYIASHVCAVEGVEAAEGEALVSGLLQAMTPAEAILRHSWQPGDVIIWDERATLHRGRPWNYEEPRLLASICVTAGDADGLESVRPN
ncbi:MAG: TauD/TfdA family dioxygenase [Pseudomonadota bacterium]